MQCPWQKRSLPHSARRLKLLWNVLPVSDSELPSNLSLYRSVDMATCQGYPSFSLQLQIQAGIVDHGDNHSIPDFPSDQDRWLKLSWRDAICVPRDQMFA